VSTTGVVSGVCATTGVVVAVLVAVVVAVSVLVAVGTTVVAGAPAELPEPPDPDEGLGVTITGSSIGGVTSGVVVAAVSGVEVATGSSSTDSVVVAVVLEAVVGVEVAAVDSGVVVAISVEGRLRTADSGGVEVPARSSAPIVFATRRSDGAPLLLRVYKSIRMLPIPTQAPKNIGQKPILV